MKFTKSQRSKMSKSNVDLFFSNMAKANSQKKVSPNPKMSKSNVDLFFSNMAKKKRIQTRKAFRNTKTPLQQHPKLVKGIANNIESFLFHESALHQANPKWQIRTTHIGNIQIYDPRHMIVQDDRFKKLLRDFLDSEIKKYTYLMDPEMSPDPENEQFYDEITLSSIYGLIILRVNYDIGGDNFSKYYSYNGTKFHCCIEVKNIINIKSTPVVEDIPVLRKYLLRLWATSTGEFVRNNLAINPFPNADRTNEINRKIFKLINTVYIQEGKNLNNTIHRIAHHIRADDDNNNDDL